MSLSLIKNLFLFVFSLRSVPKLRKCPHLYIIFFSRFPMIDLFEHFLLFLHQLVLNSCLFKLFLGLSKPSSEIKAFFLKYFDILGNGYTFLFFHLLFINTLIFTLYISDLYWYCVKYFKECFKEVPFFFYFLLFLDLVKLTYLAHYLLGNYLYFLLSWLRGIVQYCHY